MRFNYIDFVKISITTNPVSPSSLIRSAIDNGACEQSDVVLKKLKNACECIASTSEYKRTRVPEVKGYQYKKV